MILKALTGKAMPYIAIGVAGLIVVMLAALIWLMQDRDRLNAQVGELELANVQLAQSAREQAAENAQLNADIKRRDNLVVTAVKARQLAESNALKLQQQLQEALANDACANTDHPGVVADSLRLRSGGDHPDGVPAPAKAAD